MPEDTKLQLASADPAADLLAQLRDAAPLVFSEGRVDFDKLKAALEQHLGRTVRVRVAAGEVRGTSVAALEASDRSAKRSEAARSMEGDRFVKDLVTLLDGKVLEQSVQPAPKNH